MDGSDHLQRDAAREPRTGEIAQRSGTEDRRGRWGPGWIAAAALLGARAFLGAAGVL